MIGCNSVHGIFPDIPFGPHQDIICGFRMRDSYSNLTTGSRAILEKTPPGTTSRMHFTFRVDARFALAAFYKVLPSVSTGHM